MRTFKSRARVIISKNSPLDIRVHSGDLWLKSILDDIADYCSTHFDNTKALLACVSKNISDYDLKYYAYENEGEYVFIVVR